MAPSPPSTLSPKKNKITETPRTSRVIRALEAMDTITPIRPTRTRSPSKRAAEAATSTAKKSSLIRVGTGTVKTEEPPLDDLLASPVLLKRALSPISISSSDERHGHEGFADVSERLLQSTVHRDFMASNLRGDESDNGGSGPDATEYVDQLSDNDTHSDASNAARMKARSHLPILNKPSIASAWEPDV
ncbi:hypothetical protein C0991_009389, partial [Blastosporella zonata]